jgi:hypothetical protein
MRAMLWPLIVLILSTVSFSSKAEEAVAAALPGLKSYEAVYQSKIKGLSVKMHRKLVIAGDTMSLSMKASKLMFAINEESLMLVQDGKLLPRRFIHKRKGLGERHNKDLIFDWEENVVRDQLKPERAPLPLVAGTQDKLSYHALFRSLLLSEPRKERYEFPVTDGKRDKLYAFDFIGEETIELPFGKVKTWKFKRDRGNSDRQTYIWFAIDWDYLLVRVDQIERKGEKPESMLLRSATLDGKKVTALSQ